MIRKSKTDTKANKPIQISDIVGSARLLPGESKKEYQQGLQLLLSELRNPTPMTVFLVEQINEAFWWIKRHTKDKELILNDAMKSILPSFAYGFTDEDIDVNQMLNTLSVNPDDEIANNHLAILLKKGGLSFEQLRARAIKNSIKNLTQVDSLINRQIQTIRQLQKSVDHIEMKPMLIKRLDLQIQSIERDLNSIDGQSSQA